MKTRKPIVADIPSLPLDQVVALLGEDRRGKGLTTSVRRAAQHRLELAIEHQKQLLEVENAEHGW